ncbi:MAG: NUDIX hydrolase [Nanoarchaeota archaeon]|nr:NUDIX hydrolase [Nanoarchaeota archaeon]MBU1321534.1 NUDIX hydrolase [Nanoarchaeota archaeon]MBU1597156.1 NUDIX hydrolase [Nanoarchaeota archaeon]MBU2441159.1 NUDIX hydrolase [Nanoarchaeota archaeon]
MAEKIAIRPCVVLFKDNKVLCIRSKYADGEYYLFPGGGIESGETILNCAIREMREETGLTVDIVKLIYVNDWIKDKKSNERVLNMFFLAKHKSGKIIKGEKDGGKVKSVEWIDLDKFSEIDFRPKSVAKRIKKDSEKNFQELVYFE